MSNGDVSTVLNAYRDAVQTVLKVLILFPEFFDVVHGYLDGPLIRFTNRIHLLLFLPCVVSLNKSKII